MSLPTAARMLVAALLVTAAVLGVGVLAGTIRAPDGSDGPPSGAGTVPPAEVAAAAVLEGWDAARADAWAAGDLRSLGALYTPGSTAGRRDRQMLGEWLERGLVVRGLRTQVLAVHELRRSSRTWVIRVTDRVAAGSAVGRGVARPLPQDSATTTVVTLRRDSGRWLVDSVAGVRS